MSHVPDNLRREIIREIYKRLDHLRWEQLGPGERSKHYAAFVNDPEIGGRLNPYKDESGIRVWIKDGPAKEYRRAIEGAGPYAIYTDRQLVGPNELVEQALGVGWSILEDSVMEKPMRCDARNGDGRVVRTLWGPPAVFKELLWHAALTKTDNEDAQVAIIVAKTSMAPLPEQEWTRFRKLSALVGVACHQVTQNMSKKTGTRRTPGNASSAP